MPRGHKGLPTLPGLSCYGQKAPNPTYRTLEGHKQRRSCASLRSRRTYIPVGKKIACDPMDSTLFFTAQDSLMPFYHWYEKERPL